MKKKSFYYIVIGAVILLLSLLIAIINLNSKEQDSPSGVKPPISNTPPIDTSQKYSTEEIDAINSRQVSVLFYSAEYNSDMDAPSIELTESSFKKDNTLNVLKMLVRDYGESYELIRSDIYDGAEFDGYYYLVTFDKKTVWIIYEQPDGSYAIPHYQNYDEVINKED